MEELLELARKSYSFFYIGQDKEGWLYFSKLIEWIQYNIVDEHLDVNVKKIFTDFIGVFEEIEVLKSQNNIVLIADKIRSFEERLSVFKELN